MKRIHYTMRLAMLLSILLCFSLFSACSGAADQESEITAATQPAETVETTAGTATETTVSVSDEETALMKCKLALEDIQSYDTYLAKSFNQFEGEAILNDTSETFYTKDGEDWLQYTKIPETGILDGEPVWFSCIAYMCKDGNYYNTERDGYMDSDFFFHWGKTTASEEDSPWFYTYRGPWIYTFDWEAQEVTLISQLKAGTGESIRLQVNAPYAEDTEYEDYADSYTAELYFDAEGRFEKAIVMYYATRTGSGTECYIRTETIRSIDPQEVANDFDYYVKMAIDGCGDESCTVCYG